MVMVAGAGDLSSQIVRCDFEQLATWQCVEQKVTFQCLGMFEHVFFTCFFYMFSLMIFDDCLELSRSTCPTCSGVGNLGLCARHAWR